MNTELGTRGREIYSRLKPGETLPDNEEGEKFAIDLATQTEQQTIQKKLDEFKKYMSSAFPKGGTGSI